MYASPRTREKVETVVMLSRKKTKTAEEASNSGESGSN